MGDLIELFKNSDDKAMKRLKEGLDAIDDLMSDISIAEALKVPLTPEEAERLRKLANNKVLRSLSLKNKSKKD